jgi:cysteine desulfurase/selenocysteine lyase
MLAQHSGATLKYVSMDGQGALNMEDFHAQLTAKTKILAFNHISNALGTINPVKAMAAAAHALGAVVVVDGAQALPHSAIDVQDLDVDFYAGSAHKMYGPTGIGLLYGKTSWLEKLPPYQGGGEMIAEVAMEKSSYAGLPHKFEAGTPNIAGVIGWGAAIQWMHSVGMDQIEAHEHELLQYGTALLEAIPGVKIYGKAPKKAAVLSFNVAGLHPYDVGTLLDQMGIAVRTGQHCTQPIMDEFGIPGTIRASLAAYTSKEDLDALARALEKAIALLS